MIKAVERIEKRKFLWTTRKWKWKGKANKHKLTLTLNYLSSRMNVYINKSSSCIFILIDFYFQLSAVRLFCKYCCSFYSFLLFDCSSFLVTLVGGDFSFPIHLTQHIFSFYIHHRYIYSHICIPKLWAIFQVEWTFFWQIGEGFELLMETTISANIKTHFIRVESGS